MKALLSLTFPKLFVGTAAAVSGVVGASYQHRTDLDDWSLPAFVATDPSEYRNPEFGGPGSGLDLHLEPVGEPLLLRIDEVDIRGAWPVSEVAQRTLDSARRTHEMRPTIRFEDVSTSKAADWNTWAFLLHTPPEGSGHPARGRGQLLAGGHSGPILCPPGLPLGAHRCFGITPADGFAFGPWWTARGEQCPRRFHLSGRGLVAEYRNLGRDEPAYLVRLELILTRDEVPNLPPAPGIDWALLSNPDRDMDGDGEGDAWTFRVEATGTSIDLMKNLPGKRDEDHARNCR